MRGGGGGGSDWFHCKTFAKFIKGMPAIGKNIHFFIAAQTKQTSKAAHTKSFCIMKIFLD